MMCVVFFYSLIVFFKHAIKKEVITIIYLSFSFWGGVYFLCFMEISSLTKFSNIPRMSCPLCEVVNAAVTF